MGKSATTGPNTNMSTVKKPASAKPNTMKGTKK